MGLLLIHSKMELGTKLNRETISITE
jgi:hypothetical protein